MQVKVESPTALPGRSGEKNGRKWSYRKQFARGEFETRDGEKYWRDFVIKLWDDDQPYAIGEYELVPVLVPDQYGELRLANFVLDPLKADFIRKAS